jgi:hypothetical protein
MIFKEFVFRSSRLRRNGKAAKINFLKKYALKIKTPTQKPGAHHMLSKN